MTTVANEPVSAPGKHGIPTEETPRRNLLLPLLTAGSTAVFGTIGVVTTDDAAALQQRSLDLGTHSARLTEGELTAQAGDDMAGAMRRLQQRSGLTWGELAGALGVSRRAVHHWASGRRLSSRHARRLQELARLVAECEGVEPDETRSHLLAPRSDGRSALADFREASRPPRTAPLSAVPLAEFLAEGEAPAAPPAARPVASGRLKPRRLGRPGPAAGST